MPDLLGFSIFAAGKASKKDDKGKLIVESIDRCYAIDLVADSGTTRSLIESADMAETAEDDVMSAEEAVDEAFAHLISTLVQFGHHDEANKVIKHHKTFKGGGKKAEGEEGESEVEESARADGADGRDAELASLRLERDCRILCESANVPATPELLSLLSALPGQAEREQLLGWQKQAKAKIKPRSGTPVIPAKSGHKELVESKKQDTAADDDRVLQEMRG